MKAFVLFASCVLASPALAQSMEASPSGNGAGQASEAPVAPESASATAGRPADGERRICRQIESDTGSRMGTRRVCRTASEWRNTQRVN